MILFDLLKKSNWDDVKTFLLKYYTANDSNIINPVISRDKYELVYNSLFKIDAEIYDMFIEISYQTYEDDNEIYPEVYGTNNTLNEDGDKLEKIDLSSNPWKEWLGMKVSERIINEIDLNEIVALCLYEMTLWGMDEETIQEFCDKFDKDSIELMKTINEDIKVNTYKLEDIEKKFELDNQEG